MSTSAADPLAPDTSTNHCHHHQPPSANLEHHPDDLAQRNAAHFDEIAHEHAHNHTVKQVASSLAEKIVDLLGIRPQDEKGHHDDHDHDDHNDHNDHNDHGANNGITVLDYACGAGQSPYPHRP
jgi:hypothetical protein